MLKYDESQFKESNRVEKLIDSCLSRGISVHNEALSYYIELFKNYKKRNLFDSIQHKISKCEIIIRQAEYLIFDKKSKLTLYDLTKTFNEINLKTKLRKDRSKLYYTLLKNKSYLLRKNISFYSLLESDTILKERYFDIISKKQKNLSNPDSNIYFNNQLEKFYTQNNILQEPKTATVLQLQQYCKANNDIILDYFQTEDSTYVCIITSNKFTIQGLDSTKAINQNIKRLLSNIQQQKADTISHYLYKKLLPDITYQHYKNLVVIPDGSLYNLPFEVLSTTKEYITNNLLLYKIPITYQFNSALLLQHNSPKKVEITAFAPIFKDNSALFLPKSLYEVSQLKEMYKGNYFLYENANVANFTKFIKSNTALHLSTHAQADSNMQNYIQLYDKKIFLQDIQQAQIHTPFIFLSACETAQGKLHSTEGNISIAREFLSLGVPNIVSTQWNISDEASQKIVARFYSYLSEGKPIAQALQQAKIDFIKNEYTLEAPLYWAAFTYYGSNDSIIPEKKHLKLIIIVTIASMITVVFMLIYYKRVKK